MYTISQSSIKKNTACESLQGINWGDGFQARQLYTNKEEYTPHSWEVALHSHIQVYRSLFCFGEKGGTQHSAHRGHGPPARTRPSHNPHDRSSRSAAPSPLPPATPAPRAGWAPPAGSSTSTRLPISRGMVKGKAKPEKQGEDWTQAA